MAKAKKRRWFEHREYTNDRHQLRDARAQRPTACRLRSATTSDETNGGIHYELHTHRVSSDRANTGR